LIKKPPPNSPENQSLQKDIRETNEKINRLKLALLYRNEGDVLREKTNKWKEVAIQAFEQLYSQIGVQNDCPKHLLLSTMGIRPEILEIGE
jgi:two-component SAPR family response regulator